MLNVFHRDVTDVFTNIITAHVTGVVTDIVTRVFDQAYVDHGQFSAS